MLLYAIHQALRQLAVVRSHIRSRREDVLRRIHCGIRGGNQLRMLHLPYQAGYHHECRYQQYQNATLPPGRDNVELGFGNLIHPESHGIRASELHDVLSRQSPRKGNLILSTRQIMPGAVTLVAPGIAHRAWNTIVDNRRIDYQFATHAHRSSGIRNQESGTERRMRRMSAQLQLQDSILQSRYQHTLFYTRLNLAESHIFAEITMVEISDASPLCIIQDQTIWIREQHLIAPTGLDGMNAISQTRNLNLLQLIILIYQESTLAVGTHIELVAHTNNARDIDVADTGNQFASLSIQENA